MGVQGAWAPGGGNGKQGTSTGQGVAHVRQSRPDSGLECKAEAMKTSWVVPSLLGSGLLFPLLLR